MNSVTVPTITGRRLPFPPGHVRVTLNEEHRRGYLRLYALAFPLADVPALKDRDFDGRSITMTRSQLAALNSKLRALSSVASPVPTSAYGRQDHDLSRHFKKMQFLS